MKTRQIAFVVAALVVAGLAVWYVTNPLLSPYLPPPQASRTPSPPINILPNGWKEFDASGVFTFMAPPDMKAGRGATERNGTFWSSGITLEYRYGKKKADPLAGYSTRAQYRESKIGFSGEWARTIMFYDRRFIPRWIAAMRFDDVGDGNSLTLWATCRTPADQEAAERIFASLELRSPPVSDAQMADALAALIRPQKPFAGIALYPPGIRFGDSVNSVNALATAKRLDAAPGVWGEKDTILTLTVPDFIRTPSGNLPMETFFVFHDDRLWSAQYRIQWPLKQRGKAYDLLSGALSRALGSPLRSQDMGKHLFDSRIWTGEERARLPHRVCAAGTWWVRTRNCTPSFGILCRTDGGTPSSAACTSADETRHLRVRMVFSSPSSREQLPYRP